MNDECDYKLVKCLFYLEVGPLEYVDFPNDNFQHLHEFSRARLFQHLVRRVLCSLFIFKSREMNFLSLIVVCKCSNSMPRR